MIVGSVQRYDQALGQGHEKKRTVSSLFDWAPRPTEKDATIVSNFENLWDILGVWVSSPVYIALSDAASSHVPCSCYLRIMCNEHFLNKDVIFRVMSLHDANGDKIICGMPTTEVSTLHKTKQGIRFLQWVVFSIEADADVD